MTYFIEKLLHFWHTQKARKIIELGLFFDLLEVLSTISLKGDSGSNKTWYSVRQRPCLENRKEL